MIDEKKYTELGDERLCALAQQGDRRAEETLVLRCNKLVRACSRPLFLMGGDQEDLMQEGMVGLLKAMRDYDPEKGASFHTFAETCVRNRMLDAIRAASGNHNTPLNQSVLIGLWFPEQFSQETPSPEEAYILQETRKEQAALLRKGLSPLEGKVLDLYLSGDNIPEIAQKLNRSVKSIYNAIQRIRQKLNVEKSNFNNTGLL